VSDRVLERKTFQAGDMLFKEGEAGNIAFIIQSGEIEIVKSAGEDNESVLASVGERGIIGEMALLDNSNRMATARASIGGSAIVISRQLFELKMHTADPFIRGLLNILADHVRRLGALHPADLAALVPEAEAAPTSEAAPAPAPAPKGEA
jgi:CRP/FNR family cyclic AMP-dependent transcriptional regulator